MHHSKNTHVLALDVGGTNIRLALATPSGHIIARQQYECSLSRLQTSSNDHATEVLQTLTSAIKTMLQSHADIQSIGIGFPGFFRQQTGILAASPNIPGLVDFPLAEELHQAVSLPVYAQNDAALAALGEFHCGIGKGLKSLLHLTLGTGVGSGLILNEALYLGESGMAAEIGHLCVVPNGRICGCGGSGCLETYASASGIVTRYAETVPSDATSAKDVYHKAVDGNAEAIQILHEAGTYLGQAIAEAIKLLDIHNVSLSGGLTGAWEFLSEPMHVSLNANLIPPLKGKIKLHRSRLGDDAGLLGAAMLALKSTS